MTTANETLSNRIVTAMRRQNINCSLITVMAKLTDGGDEQKFKKLEHMTVEQIEERIKEIFNK